MDDMPDSWKKRARSKKKEITVEGDQTFMQQLVAQVVPQLIALAGALVAAGIVWVRSKTGQMIRNNIKNEAMQKALLYANGRVMDLVSAASQTTVQSLKEKLADGKLQREEYDALLVDIKKDLLTELHGDGTVAKLVETGAAATVSAARSLLSSKIEAAVPLAKAAQAAAKNGSAVPLAKAAQAAAKNGSAVPKDPTQG